MRRLRRPAVTPPTLNSPGKGGRQAVDNVRARTADPAAPLSFTDHWKEPDVRGALLAMHGRACAYCQCGLSHNDPGDVEHFRPKSDWWLAYDFSNYLLSCARCNRICKRGDFPRPSGSEPCRWEDRDHLREEKILLLDPVVDEVEEWLRAERRHDVLFFIEPAVDLRQSEDRFRAQTTIRHFQLNFSQLLRQRSLTIYRMLQALKPALAGDRDRMDEVRRMASRFQPYGATIRQILAETAPEFIPTPEEDFKELVVDLLTDLSTTDAALALKPQSRPDRRFRTEILWALAVLWKDPPTGSPGLVESWLIKAKCRDEVAGLLAQL